MRVYIWGTGKYALDVLRCLNFQHCEFMGFIDNDINKQGRELEGYQIFSYEKSIIDAKYIVVSAIKYNSILHQIREDGRFEMNNMIAIFDKTCQFSKYKFLDAEKCRIMQLENRIVELETLINNIGYEIIDKYENGGFKFPKIRETQEAINKIVLEKCSLVRFGDGEFEIMSGNERPVFQKYSAELAEKLKSVLAANDEKFLISIADNYGSLEEYTSITANGIRKYMTAETREKHLSMLDLGKEYYDAYMFKCYFPYKDKENTEARVQLIKKIWKNRDVLLIEGEKTRSGVGNDLFENANSIERILAPTENAFSVYNQIFSRACQCDINKLILIALGPAGKVLTYDLFKKGYQVVDIGQIDMDYEWYKMGAKDRMPIFGKYVSQLPSANIGESNDEEYKKQIIDVIC